MKRNPSDEQREIIKTRNTLSAIRACPGSGKTYAVAARLEKILSEWNLTHQGIAAASFTNVAWQEIDRCLRDEFGVLSFPVHPHFLGTLDSFINSYIFLPFGHLVTGCSRRPVLTGPPHDTHEPIGRWMWWRSPVCNQKGCQLNEFSYDADGKLIRMRHQAMGESCQFNPQHPCVNNKRTFSKLGYATQPDSNYFALRVLLEYPLIAAALALRFPVIMVDEAQDTSAIQMRILERLVEGGLQDLMLIGDPDQAIYEWRDAEPHLFLEKCEAWGKGRTGLTENWRSSQRICDCASHFASSTTRMRAVNPEVADVSFAPLVLEWEREDKLPCLADFYIEHCKGLGIPPSGVAVLSRSKELLNAIKPGSADDKSVSLWGDLISERVARSRFLYENGQYALAFRSLERAILQARSARDTFDPMELWKLYESGKLADWRGDVFELLCSLPWTSGRAAGDWANEANDILKNSRFPELRVGVKRNSQKCRYQDLKLAGAFAQSDLLPQENEAVYKTVHAVKGETLDAVMLALKKKAGQGPFYVNLLGKDIAGNEELRIVYVAITRARRMLALAVPSKAASVWAKWLGLSK